MLKLRYVFLALLGLVLLLGASDCNGKPPATRADLVPKGLTELTGPISYCRLETGKLVVTVRNQGEAAAIAATATIEFLPAGGTVTRSIPATSVGGEVNLSPVDFPIGCYNPDCDFRITIDSANDVDESNETNNVADGLCIG